MAFHCLIIITAISQVVSIVLLVCIISGVDAADSDARCNATCTYTAWALDADCRDRGLTEVPRECSPSEMVNLRNNDLTHLGPDSFAGYTQLQYLDLEFNSIDNVTRGAFRGCVSLQNVYLQFNFLTEVGEGAFEGATDLKRLFLNQNSITDIHPDAFYGLDKLNGLYIGHNDIARLHASLLQHTPHLQYLHMGNNSLTQFPKGIFDTLTELIYINAENNNLQLLEGSLLVNLVNLREVNLAGNLIHSIPSFPDLPRLTTLDLFDNKLGNIGTLADKTDGLDQLYLAENNNLNCTCSMVPVREWVRRHIYDEDVDTPRANATCGWPRTLRGTPLHRLTNTALCRQRVGVSAAAAVAPTTQTAPVHSMTSVDLSAVREEMPQNSKFDPIIIYVMLGLATFIGVAMFLFCLVKYLNWHTQRHQQQREIATNRRIQEDDGAYEPVCFRPHSPSDSAFGSQDDVLTAHERPVPTHWVPPYDSGNPHVLGHVSSPRRTTEQGNALHRSPLTDDNCTSDEETLPLNRALQDTNPFMNNMLDQTTTCTPYISHEEYRQMYICSEHCKRQTQIPAETSQLTHPSSMTKSLNRNPFHNSITRNPFHNSITRNPFMHCA